MLLILVYLISVTCESICENNPIPDPTITMYHAPFPSVYSAGLIKAKSRLTKYSPFNLTWAVYVFYKLDKKPKGRFRRCVTHPEYINARSQTGQGFLLSYFKYLRVRWDCHRQCLLIGLVKSHYRAGGNRINRLYICVCSQTMLAYLKSSL